MKIKIYKIVILIILLIGIPVSLQAETFTYTLQNTEQTASNVLEFDLYLLNKDAGTPIEISGIQAGITLNSAIANGGTITAELVAGSSDLVSAEQPTAITYTSATYCLKIAAKAGPGAGKGTVMSATAPGTRYCRVRLTNTVAFASASPNLTFSFSTTPYATKLFAYVGGISTQLNTDDSNTYNATSNDVLNQPIISTDSIKNIGATSAIGYATIASLGYPATLSSYGVCYSSTNTTPTITDNIVDKGTTTTTGVISASITGLMAGTIYYIRAYAANDSAIGYGEVKAITTLALPTPTVTTRAVSDISTTTATGSATITGLGNADTITAYGFCWSRSNNNPTVSDSVVNNGSAINKGNFVAQIKNLIQGVTYYTRAYVTNVFGTGYGEVIVFKASVQTPPTVTTDTISNIGVTIATVTGRVIDLGNPINRTTYGICYSNINATPTTSDSVITNNTRANVGVFSVTITSLTFGTRYYVRAFATNSSGTSYGEIQSFTTRSQRQLFLKVYLQGLFNGVNMNKCLIEDGLTSKFFGVVVDTISVELHDAKNYTTTVYKALGLELNQDGSVNSIGKTYIEIPGLYSGSYYITVKTRNHLETTSAQSVLFASDANTLVYDFTTAASKAYGNNMLFEEGAYVIYAGDIIQDGILDISDVEAINNEIARFGVGYVKEDLNGDGIVDISDIVLVETNISNFVSVDRP